MTLITPFLQVVPLLVVGGRVGSGFFLPVGVGYSCRRSGLPKMGLLADLISHTHILTNIYQYGMHNYNNMKLKLNGLSVDIWKRN